MTKLTSDKTKDLAQKLSHLLTGWIIQDVSFLDVTHYHDTKPVPCYLTFEPEAFRFLVRKTGDPLTAKEIVLGTQIIDMVMVREQSQKLYDSQSASSFQAIYLECMCIEILRYWRFYGNLENVIEVAVLSLNETASGEMISKIEQCNRDIKDLKRSGTFGALLSRALDVVNDEACFDFATFNKH